MKLKHLLLLSPFILVGCLPLPEDIVYDCSNATTTQTDAITKTFSVCMKEGGSSMRCSEYTKEMFCTPYQRQHIGNKNISLPTGVISTQDSKGFPVD